jgi:hypothetical protein
MLNNCFCYVIYGRDTKYYAPVLTVSQTLAGISGASVVIATVDDDYLHVCAYFAICENIEVINFGPRFAGHERMLRFLVPQYIESNYYHFRDSDSIVTESEMSLISVFGASSYSVMIIRNHPLHFSPIMAGMFSLKYELAIELAKSIIDGQFLLDTSPYYDQIFLTKQVYMQNLEKSLILSSNIVFVGERASIIAFDMFNFIGMPNHWTRAECDFSLNYFSEVEVSPVIRIPFCPLVYKLYQRTRFILVLLKLRKLLKIFLLKSNNE